MTSKLQEPCGSGHLARFRCLGAEHDAVALVTPASCTACRALLSRQRFFSTSLDLSEAIDIYKAGVPDVEDDDDHIETRTRWLRRADGGAVTLEDDQDSTNHYSLQRSQINGAHGEKEKYVTNWARDKCSDTASELSSTMASKHVWITCQEARRPPYSTRGFPCSLLRSHNRPMAAPPHSPGSPLGQSAGGGGGVVVAGCSWAAWLADTMADMSSTT
ncbi:unnamed protein product [Boreogadus saida]